VLLSANAKGWFTWSDSRPEVLYSSFATSETVGSSCEAYISSSPISGPTAMTMNPHTRHFPSREFLGGKKIKIGCSHGRPSLLTRLGSVWLVSLPYHIQSSEGIQFWNVEETLKITTAVLKNFQENVFRKFFESRKQYYNLCMGAGRNYFQGELWSSVSNLIHCSVWVQSPRLIVTPCNVIAIRQSFKCRCCVVSMTMNFKDVEEGCRVNYFK
jgi:hypothetical protein